MGILKNPRHEKFCQEYIKNGGNATKSYVDAGYKDNSNSRIQASKLVTNNNVIKRMDELREQVQKKDIVTRESLIQDAIEIKERCMQKQPVMEWDPKAREWIPTGEWQFNVPGALKAIEWLGNVVGTEEEGSDILLITEEEKGL